MKKTISLIPLLLALFCVQSNAAGLSEGLVQRCGACHGPDLRGVGGVFPDLLTSEMVRLGDLEQLNAFVKNGSAADSAALAKMPPRGGHLDLSDREIGDLVLELVTLSREFKEPVVQAAPATVFTERYGPVLSTAVEVGKTGDGRRYIVSRAHLVPLGEDRRAAVVFDSDTLSYSVAWFDPASMTTRGMPFGGAHGRCAITKPSNNLFKTGLRPGWARDGALTDPRHAPYDKFPPLGPLPKDWAHFKGHYVHNGRTIFSYSVGKGSVLDMPGFVHKERLSVITRTLNVNNPDASVLVLAEGTEGTFSDKTLAIKNSEQGCNILMVHGPADAELVFEKGVAALKLPAGQSKVKLAFWEGDALYQPAVWSMVDEAEDLSAYTKGGDPQWGDALAVKSELSTDTNSAYVVDRIGIPTGNPMEPRMRTGGFDFFADGTTAAVCTWDGDVWIVSDIDETLENVQWKRFATGLHESLGLAIADEKIYAVADDQITRFHDLNKDGEADFYENFNNDWDLTEGFHAFCFDLQTGPEGDFFFSMGSPVRAGGRGFERMGRQHGSIIRVSNDGSTMTRYASGFRAPNGIGVGPDGQVTAGDNEGSFVPSAPLHWVEPGKFHGVVDSYEQQDQLKTTSIEGYFKPKSNKTLVPEEAPKPLVWMSKKRGVDNSGGGQVWATSDKWGPLRDALLHLSYGRSTVALVLKESKGGLMQGGVYELPVKLTSSAMRARMNARDGQLYTMGLKGWQTNARKPAGFDRIRYTGKPAYLPSSLNVRKDRINIGFTQPLRPAEAAESVRYKIRAWNLKWTHNYGSPETAVDGFAVEKAELLDDGRTVSLHVPGLHPVHMMEIHFDVIAADGTPVKGTIDNTIHVVD